MSKNNKLWTASLFLFNVKFKLHKTLIFNVLMHFVTKLLYLFNNILLYISFSNMKFILVHTFTIYLHTHQDSILHSLLSVITKIPMWTTIGYIAIFNYLPGILAVSLYFCRRENIKVFADFGLLL